jgi:hypothetical protein
MNTEISQANNATRNAEVTPRFGIRVSAPPQDPFTRIVGEDWNTVHWFGTREERDQQMQEMAARHRYSRRGDLPSIVLEPIER